MDIQKLAKNPDRLLTEIGFAGAMYGMYSPVLAIATHLGANDKTRSASVLMLGVLNMALKNYDGARQILESVAGNESYGAYQGDAAKFLATLNQISPKK